MKKILITRPADVAKKMADRLSKHGFECVLDPMLIPRKIENVIFMERHAEDGFIFTSPRAVQCFVDIASKIDFNLPAYCVGSKTAAVAEGAGFKNIIAGHGDGEELAQIIKNQAKEGAHFLHPCGEHVEDSFYEILRDDGFIVAPLSVYHMEKAPRMQEDALVEIRTDDVDVVVFFSKRTVEAFVDLAKKDGVIDYMKSVNALCISKDVADMLDKQQWEKIHIAKNKTEDGLIKALLDLRENK